LTAHRIAVEIRPAPQTPLQLEVALQAAAAQFLPARTLQRQILIHPPVEAVPLVAVPDPYQEIKVKSTRRKSILAPSALSLSSQDN
jgi:hypothetical protein